MNKSKNKNTDVKSIIQKGTKTLEDISLFKVKNSVVYI